MSKPEKGLFRLRIYLKNEKGRRFFIPAPIWLVKAGIRMAGIGMKQEKKDPEREKKICLDAVNYREMNKALDLLKRYKGLELVDIKAKDGTEIRIIV